MSRPGLNFSQFKPFLYLGCFLAGWLFLPPVFKNTLRDTSYEFQAPLWVGSSHLRDVQTTLDLRTRSKNELIESVRDLSRENAFYRQERAKLNEYQDYIGRLEGLLNLPSLPEYRYEVARVIRRDLTAWWERLIIRKGRDFNIPVGAAVVFSGGVVGRVTKVHAYTSDVELVSSPLFRMAARFENDQRPATYQGRIHNSFGQPFGKVSDAPPDIQASSTSPITLVSTALGGTFPSGIPIGTVYRLKPGSDGLFQTGPVVLDKRLLTIQEVAILIPLDSELTPEDEEAVSP